MYVHLCGQPETSQCPKSPDFSSLDPISSGGMVSYDSGALDMELAPEWEDPAAWGITASESQNSTSSTTASSGEL